jgi:mutator protein MutT
MNVNKKHQDAIIVFIFNEEYSKVLMLNRVKNYWGFDWGFMVGKIEQGEKPEQGAKREIKEELGISNVQLKQFKKKEYNKDNETYYHYYYLCTLPEKTSFNIQLEEIKEVGWFGLDDLPKRRAPDDPYEALKYKTSN